MTRSCNAVRAASRIACLALAGVALFAAWTHHAACAAWVAVGLFAVWYIGHVLLAFLSPVVVPAYLAVAQLARAALAVPASWPARLRARVALARVSLRRASADRLFLRRAVAALFLLACLLSVPVSLSAGIPGIPGLGGSSNASPWETVGVKLCELFYGKLGKALAIVAVVIGGLLYAFGEGGSKSQLAGIAFGTGMVLMAPSFLGWLFAGSGSSVTGTMTCQSAFGGSGNTGIGIP